MKKQTKKTTPAILDDADKAIEEIRKRGESLIDICQQMQKEDLASIMPHLKDMKKSQDSVLAAIEEMSGKRTSKRKGKLCQMRPYYAPSVNGPRLRGAVGAASGMPSAA